MTDEEVQPNEIEPEGEQLPPQPEPAGFDAYRSIVRLLIGLALAGGDELIGRLREWEAAHPPESTGLLGEPEIESAGDLARRALIGMAFGTAEAARQVAEGAASLPVSLAGAMWSAFRPVAGSFLFRPLWAPVRAVATRGEASLERWTRTGRSEEQRTRRLAGEVTGVIIEDVVSYVIGYLAGRAESLDPLVREVGDRYLAYLREHPDAVQDLVQGQAVGMATEVRDDVRTITVTGDTFLETLARALLRRTPREELPPPPPQVQQRAEMGRRTGDFPRPEGGEK